MYGIEVRTTNFKALTDAQKEDIAKELGELFVEWGDRHSHQVYVPFGKVIEAVEILNGLGYETDEDPHEDEDEDERE